MSIRVCDAHGGEGGRYWVIGKENAGKGGEDEDENDVTYLSKLFHEDGVPEQLQAHHFRILRYCPR